MSNYRDITDDRGLNAYNCRVKLYRNGYVEIMSCSRGCFRPGDALPLGSPAIDPTRPRRSQSDDPIGRAIRRARARVRDIALANDLRWFVTLTLSPERIDRYSDRDAIRRTCQWADNQVRNHGMQYVLVPERHKDGAIHLHGLVAWRREAGRVVDAGVLRRPGVKSPMRPRSDAERDDWIAHGAQRVYNIPGWTLGYSTAIAVYGDYSCAVGYVCKYIGKALAEQRGDDLPIRIGGRWYYSGGDLQQPQDAYLDMMPDEVAAIGGAYHTTIDACGGMDLSIWRGYLRDLPEIGGRLVLDRCTAEVAAVADLLL